MDDKCFLCKIIRNENLHLKYQDPEIAQCDKCKKVGCRVHIFQVYYFRDVKPTLCGGCRRAEKCTNSVYHPSYILDHCSKIVNEEDPKCPSCNMRMCKNHRETIQCPLCKE